MAKKKTPTQLDREINSALATRTVTRSRGRKLPYATDDIVLTEPGKPPITIVAPSTIPTADRGEVLRRLYSEYVKPLPFGPKKETHWKGPCAAEVPAALADDVAEAMRFMGSIVDDRRDLPGGRVRLYSEGYWAHGF
jgi:hypothetical protein